MAKGIVHEAGHNSVVQELNDEWDIAKDRARDTVDWLLVRLLTLKTDSQRESFANEAQARIRRIYEDVRRRSDFLINQLVTGCPEDDEC